MFQGCRRSRNGNLAIGYRDPIDQQSHIGLAERGIVIVELLTNQLTKPRDNLGSDASGTPTKLAFEAVDARGQRGQAPALEWESARYQTP